MDDMNIFLKLHLVTIIPVLVLGPFILFRKRGDRLHILLGRLWAGLMTVSCLLTFGIQYNGKFSWLHGLAVFTLYSVGKAILAIKRKDIPSHQRAMVGSYIGVLIAFAWAASDSDRLINQWIRNWF